MDTEHLKQYLRPEDERLVRGADPTTAGLTLIAVATIRELVDQMFGTNHRRPAHRP